MRESGLFRAGYNGLSLTGCEVYGRSFIAACECTRALGSGSGGRAPQAWIDTIRDGSVWRLMRAICIALKIA